MTPEPLLPILITQLLDHTAARQAQEAERARLRAHARTLERARRTRTKKAA